MKKTVKLLYNSRFYILIFGLILSLVFAGVLRLNIASDKLFYIRLQQVYGAVSIVYLYIALISSPLAKLLDKEERIGYLLFARRAIGVSSAYFALLHSSIALLAQIGGLVGFRLLPDIFKISIVFGFFSLLILSILALTSFDKVVGIMTFKRWKLLHRLVYGSGILIILHVWLIGTHLDYVIVQWGSFAALATLAGLECLRVYKHLKVKNDYSTFGSGIIACLLFLSVILATLMIPMIDSYRDSHQEHTDDVGHSNNTEANVFRDQQ